MRRTYLKWLQRSDIMRAKIMYSKCSSINFFGGEMPVHEVINVCGTPNILKILDSQAAKSSYKSIRSA